MRMNSYQNWLYGYPIKYHQPYTHICLLTHCIHYYQTNNQYIYKENLSMPNKHVLFWYSQNELNNKQDEDRKVTKLHHGSWWKEL